MWRLTLYNAIGGIPNQWMHAGCSNSLANRPRYKHRTEGPVESVFGAGLVSQGDATESEHPFEHPAQ